VLAAFAFCAFASRAVAMTAAAGSTPASHHFRGNPTVGALFPGGYPGFHTCTASVIRSTRRDVIMTAAHCVSGRAKGIVFAPGYHDGKAPYGLWRVTAAYGSPRWIHHNDTQRDWAFLVVANKTEHGKVVRVQDVVGGNRLGAVATIGEMIRVPAYPLGQSGPNDKPITCTTKVYLHRGFPAFNCGGYVGGTSGAPWLIGHGHARHVVGVIGGLHQGGCKPATSYSARLGAPAWSVFRRAEHHRRPNVFPTPPGDGC
jgi:Trypsin